MDWYDDAVVIWELDDSDAPCLSVADTTTVLVVPGTGTIERPVGPDERESVDAVHGQARERALVGDRSAHLHRLAGDAREAAGRHVERHACLSQAGRAPRRG